MSWCLGARAVGRGGRRVSAPGVMMVRWLGLVGLAGGLMGLGACCLPWAVDAIEQPGLEVQVLRADGQPAAGAEILLRRLITAPPPRDELARWAVIADEQGRARFERVIGSDTVMPLMMHGVPDVGFEVCARGEGGAITEALGLDARRDLDAASLDLTLTLEPGRRSCGWEPVTE
ncbi:MAG TPA: hypothetical protein ENK18_28180 [Deltaproteobacteria bacterium]|nr:hypothetical protein [Deltaproteobacteria bacterium]